MKELIKMHAPYVFLRDGDNAGTWKIFVIFNVSDNENIRLSSSGKESKDYVFDFELVERGENDENLILSGEKWYASYSNDNLIPATVIQVIVKLKDKGTKTKILISDSDSLQDAITTENGFAFYAPYSYLTKPDPGTEGIYFPRVLVVLKDEAEFIKDAEMLDPASNPRDVIHSDLTSTIQVNPFEDGEGAIVFAPPKLNSHCYQNAEGEEGFVSQVVIQNGIKKVGETIVRNKNSDNKPRGSFD